MMLVFVSSDGKREHGHIRDQGLFIHDQTHGRNQQGLSWQLFILHCCRVLRRRRQSRKMSTKPDTRRPSSQITFKYKINESGEQFRRSGLQPFSFSDDFQFPFGHRRRRSPRQASLRAKMSERFGTSIDSAGTFKGLSSETCHESVCFQNKRHSCSSLNLNKISLEFNL